MFIKFLICSTLMCLAVADVKDLSRMYLPPASEVAIEKSGVVAERAEVAKDVIQNEIVDNDLKLDSLEPSTKDAVNDPAYGNAPFGFNGLPGGFPGAFPAQGFPGQGFPSGQGFPPQGFPGQGFPPSQGFVNPGFSSQGFPGQGFPGQGLPGQFFPGQGFPAQGFYGQGFTVQRFPAPQSFPSSQNFVNPGFQGQGYYTNYPFYSSEQLKMEEKENGQDEKLRLLAVKSDTQYDATNGGYLYNKPSVTF